MTIRNFLKKTLAIVLVFAMLAPIMANLEANVQEVQAASSSDDRLNVKCQVTQGVVKNTTIYNYRDKYVMRFVSAVEDYSQYRELGFKLVEEGQTKEKKAVVKTVFKRIESTTGSTENGTKETYNYSPKVINTDAEYLMTAKLPVDNTEESKATKYTVWAYGIKHDGTEVKGTERCVSVNDGLESCTTVNMSFQNSSGIAVAENNDLKANGLDAKVIGVSGNTVHVRITPTSALPSATSFTFTKDGATVGTEIFRNLNAKYNGTADKSWYEAYPSTTEEYIIATSADLYGLASVVDGGKNLAGKVIYLVADIAANTETLNTDSSDIDNYLKWKKANGEYVSAPTNTWNPIGSHTSSQTTHHFAGTFDGQGHTIKGIYCVENSSYSGMFTRTTGNVTIKNFRLEDSYFRSGQADFGSIVGTFRGGELTQIYSNAILVNNGGLNYVGGIVGYCYNDSINTTISECWYDGNIQADICGYVGGVAGSIETTSSSKVNIQHCLYTGHIVAKNIVGGICGSTYTNAKADVVDSLSMGTASCSGATKGAIAGTFNGTISVTNTVSNTNFTHRWGGSATETNCSPTVNQADYLGLSGFGLKSYLDFNDYWVATLDGTPVLQSLSDCFLKTPGKDANGNPVYTIDSKEELYQFAMTSQLRDFANSTVKLGADITVNEGTASATAWTASEGATVLNWIPIGKGIAFGGVFDGQGHTIRGVRLVDNDYEAGLGLFSETKAGAYIKDFRLENSYFESDSPFLGGVAGSLVGTAERIYSKAVVNHTGARSYIGGLAGKIGGATTMSECWFDGTLRAGQAQWVGGLVGCINAGASNDVLIAHCLYTGDMTANKYSGGICGYVASGGNKKIADTMSMGTATFGQTSQNGSILGNGESGQVVTIDGVIGTTKINNGSVWYGAAQGTLGTDYEKANPDAFKGAAGLNLNTWLDFDKYWVAKADSTPVLQSLSDGFHKNVTKENGTVVYTINNSDELYEFAIVSQIKDFKNTIVKLGADITVNEGIPTENGWPEDVTPVNWIPIGKGKAFTGTFDGQQYTISGIFADGGTKDKIGLFAETSSSSTIKNLNLVNSYFITTDNNKIGSIAGYGLGRFYNIKSDAIVKSNNQWIGGFIGLTSSVEMERCWFAGSVVSTSSNSSHTGKGGLIGLQDGGTSSIVNCLNTGIVDVRDAEVSPKAGGLVGYVFNNASLTIDSSLNTGSIIKNSNATDGYGRLVGAKHGSCNLMISKSYATTNEWTGDDPLQASVSYEVFPETEIRAAAQDKMPLLDWENDWSWVQGELPQVRFSEKNLGEKVSYSADQDDKGLLTSAYQGLELAFGDMHAHAETDTSNDLHSDYFEKQALKTWKDEMDAHSLDFIASLDHKETDHILNDEWDENLFIYGTEPGADKISGLKDGKTGEMHYNMLFAGENAKGRLENVLNMEQFSNRFKLSNNQYSYADFSKTEFTDLIKEVQAQGGFFVIPHPNLPTALLSSDWEDFDFGVDKVGFEVVERSLGDAGTRTSYKYWKELLASGRKYFACSGSDIHGSLDEAGVDEANNALAQKALTSVYADFATYNTKSEAYMEQFKAGNFTAGSVAIQMCIGKTDDDITSMGGECDFADKRLVVKIGKMHKSVYADGRKYHVDIITDQGVIYSQPLNLTSNEDENAVIALDTNEEYKFYRVEVVDENGIRRIAYGNPIWNTSK